VSVVVYHAGLSHRARRDAHDAFMSGDVNVCVATSAFGMGIDKADVRFVLHAEVPESPDTYYQEVGRAGRDDLPALAVLFYRSEDLALGRFFSGGVPRHDDVAMVVAAARDLGPDRKAIRGRTGLGPRKVGRILNLVHDVERSPRPPEGANALADAVIARAEAQRRLEKSRVEMMRSYAESDRCRMQFLLGYFGEQLDEPCGNCDNCSAGTATDRGSESASPFPPETPVEHAEWGPGIVMRVEDDRLVVLFEEVGYKTLAIAAITENDLLRARG
jgi:ATP-dependent DNA helicase RecQ